jgi:tRNA-dihydrouridine synthase B
MRLGPLSLASPFVLAPMEEHTSLPMRLLMRRHGAAMTWAERLDAEDVAGRDKRALKLLATSPEDRPSAGQISGRDPAVCAEASRVVAEYGFAAVDLNCECPVKRVLGKGAGGALMADPPLIGRIVAAMVAACDVPVTVKLRSGPSDGVETAVEAAKAVADAGGTAVMVHSRSVATGYAGPADPAVIARVVVATTIPVIASGGVRTAADAVAQLRSTGAVAVAIARGCLGNPWIFRQARALWTGTTAPMPSTDERIRACMHLVEAECKHYGLHLGLRRLPRTACYFAKDLPTFPEFRAEIQKVTAVEQVRSLVQRHFR